MGFTNLSAKMIELKIWRLWFAKITQEYLAYVQTGILIYNSSVDLSQIVKHYRNCLSVLPDAPLYGNIPQGADKVSGKLDSFLTLEHKQFLLLCNGGSFGDIELWGAEEILDKQYRAPKNLQDSMYEAGQVLYEPIFLNRINNQVTFNVDGEKIVPFSSFIEEYVFGEKYKYIFDDADIDDMWYFFLHDNPI